jgi:hypothetical protein
MKTLSAAVLSSLAGFAIGGTVVQGLHAAAKPPAYVAGPPNCRTRKEEASV